MDAAVPEVPVPDDPDPLRVGCPNGKRRPGHSLVRPGVRTEHFPEAPVASLVEEVQVKVPKGGPVAVGVIEDEAGRTRARHRALPNGTRAPSGRGALPTGLLGAPRPSGPWPQRRCRHPGPLPAGTSRSLRAAAPVPARHGGRGANAGHSGGPGPAPRTQGCWPDLALVGRSSGARPGFLGPWMEVVVIAVVIPS